MAAPNKPFWRKIIYELLKAEPTGLPMSNRRVALTVLKLTHASSVKLVGRSDGESGTLAKSSVPSNEKAEPTLPVTNAVPLLSPALAPPTARFVVMPSPAHQLVRPNCAAVNPPASPTAKHCEYAEVLLLASVAFAVMKWQPGMGDWRIAVNAPRQSGPIAILVGTNHLAPSP